MGILLTMLRKRERADTFNGYCLVSGDNELRTFNNRASVTKYLINSVDPPIFAEIYYRGIYRKPEIKNYICNGENWLKYVSGKNYR